MKKPFISEDNRQKRLEFARNHLNWTPNDWARILWSDESKFKYFNRKARVYVRRRPGERYSIKCMVGTVKHGGGGLLVWVPSASAASATWFLSRKILNSQRWLIRIH